MSYRPDYYTISQARTALDNMDDYARMAGINPHGPRTVLEQFIDQVERKEMDCRCEPPGEVKIIEVTENPAA